MRAYSWSQLLATGFDKSEFSFPTAEGICTVLLVMKQWGDKACLTGFFVTKSGEKIKANAWQEKEYLGLDIINLGSMLNLNFLKNAKGIVVLRKATVIKNEDSVIAG